MEDTAHIVVAAAKPAQTVHYACAKSAASWLVGPCHTIERRQFPAQPWVSSVGY